MDWDEDRLHAVELEAAPWPDACSEDVISLVAEVHRLQATIALLEAVRAAVKVALDAEYRGRIYRISYRMPEGVNTIECVLCDAEMENEGLLDYETEFSHHDYCAVRGILAAYRAATALLDGAEVGAC